MSDELSATASRPTMFWINGTRRRGTTRPGRSSRSGCTNTAAARSSPKPNGTSCEAVCDRLIPQPDRPVDPVPIVPFIDEKLHKNQGNGYRYEDMPPMREAWRHRHQRDRRGGARPLAARISRTAGQSEGCGAARDAARRHAHRCLARPARQAVLFERCCCTRRWASITRTRRRGARSALAARPRRAAMSGSASTGATPGRRIEDHER